MKKLTCPTEEKLRQRLDDLEFFGVEYNWYELDGEFVIEYEM